MSTSGGQPGNRNAIKTKRWTEAIQKALKRFNRAKIDDDPKSEVKAGEALDAIALTVVEAAIDGDWWAVTEIGNRLEGKPAQTIDLNADVRHVHELSDNELLERLQRASDPPGTVETPPSPPDAGELH